MQQPPLSLSLSLRRAANGRGKEKKEDRGCRGAIDGYTERLTGTRTALYGSECYYFSFCSPRGAFVFFLAAACSGSLVRVSPGMTFFGCTRINVADLTSSSALHEADRTQ